MNEEWTEEERRLMEAYGIEAEPRTVYRYKGHTYEHLEHAIRYAQIDAARAADDERIEGRKALRFERLRSMFARGRRSSRR